MAANKDLYVSLAGECLGSLSQDKGGKIIFQYADDARRALSLSLPLEKHSFTSRQCEGYFNGLLPESDTVRAALAKRYGISARNDFSLLAAIGYDCPGAVSFSESEEDSGELEIPLEGEALSEEALEKHLLELPRKPLATGTANMRLSLAGAQDKTALIMLNGALALPSARTPSTHIIKPAIEHIAHSVENEYICMRVARELGLPVPEVSMHYANETPYYCIERYDREIVGGNVIRIHQEDLCQALNIKSSLKYENEGGPGLAQSFQLLEHCQRPIIAKRDMLERVIYNYLIGNDDAHGKNYSLLHLDGGSITFAPGYDILCTQVYASMDRRMAMRMGKEYYPREVTRRAIEKMAKDCKLHLKQIEDIASKQIKQLPVILENILNTDRKDSDIGKQIYEQLKINSAQLERILQN